MFTVISRTFRPLVALVLLAALLLAPAAVAYAAPQDVVGDATRQIVEGREFVKGYVTNVKDQFEPAAPEYVEARKRYRLALSKYNGWAASVKRAIRLGKVKDIQKDASYKAAAAEAGAAAKSFTDYVDSKMGAPKGAFAILGSLADVGIKVWNAYKDRKALERAADADAFYEDVKWDQWEFLVSDAKAKGPETALQEGEGGVEEVHLGDPFEEGAKGLDERLVIDEELLTTLDADIGGEAKGRVVDSRLLALETLNLAKSYVRAGVGRKEPPSPSKVRGYLALYGLPFRYPNGQWVPYCAAGVGFAAARTHQRLQREMDPGDNHMRLRGSLADLTRDYAYTHPATRVMVARARARGQFVAHTAKPEKGWLVFFNWSGSKAFPQHVGIVDSIDSTGRILRTVEFNTSDGNPSNGGRVEAKTRSVRYVMGYIRTYPSAPQQAAAPVK